MPTEAGSRASSFEPLHQELWGKGSGFPGIRDFTIEIPQPHLYLEPEYKSQMGQAGIHNFPHRVAPITQDKVSKELQELRVSNELPCGTSSLLIRSEYRETEGILEDAVRYKWAGADPGELPMIESPLDYKVSGQPGSGA